MAEQQTSDLDIAPYIDHALLNHTATPPLVEKWCEEADRFNFATVCVYPAYVRIAANLLHNKRPKVSTVIAFPTGATNSATKLYEAQQAIENGANELDVVINLGLLKAGKTNEVHREIAEICDTGIPVKAILETNLLNDEEKQLAAELCMDAGVAYLKTGTGWYGGANINDVRLLKQLTRGKVGIKAAGGIRTHQEAVDLIVAGATRLGTSRSIDLLRQRDNLEDNQ
jgi:deoxyribose-phosphate aldolase